MRLAVIAPARRILGVPSGRKLAPGPPAWHLGALLVGADEVWATGDIVRARSEMPRGFTAESQRRRAEIAVEAHRGGFVEGEAVHVGWTPVDLDAVDRGESSGPLSMAGGVAMIRWSPAGAPAPLDRYLAERIDLALDPPPRA